jgi:hypothetical protein
MIKIKIPHIRSDFNLQALPEKVFYPKKLLLDLL